MEGTGYPIYIYEYRGFWVAMFGESITRTRCWYSRPSQLFLIGLLNGIYVGDICRRRVTEELIRAPHTAAISASAGPTPHAYAAASWLPPSPAPGYRSHAHPDLLVLGVPVLSGLRGVYAWRRARSPRRWPRIPPVPIPYTTPRPRKQPHVDHVHGHPRGHAFPATCTKVARIPHARTRASPHARPVVRTCCVNKHV